MTIRADPAHHDGDWKPVAAEDADYRCPECKGGNVWYRVIDSDHDDVRYECRSCPHKWVAEGSDY